MVIRLSRDTDKDNIESLMGMCFGYRNDALHDLQGRYLLACDYIDDNEIIVAMTGLIWSDNYSGYEIDWTCTHPDYRNNGIMHTLFARLLSLTDEDVYCSCWRLNNNNFVNLSSLMFDFDFKEVINTRVTWKRPYNCKSTNHCVYCKSDNECTCYEDLYLRKANHS